MKELLNILALLLLSTIGYAQSYERPAELDLQGVQGIYPDDFGAIMTPDDQVLLVLFNPSCGHCTDFLDSTIAHYDDFGDDFKFVFVYGDNEELDLVFKEMYHQRNLAAYPYIMFGHAPEEYFGQYRLESLPSLFWYDSQKEHRYIKEIKPKEGNYTAFLNEIKSK